MLKLGFIGMGEASYYFAKGLMGKDVSIHAYDIAAQTEGEAGELVKARARETNVTLVQSYETLFETSDCILNLTSANAALPIAQQIKPFLQSNHIYADFNSASPVTKEKISELLADTPARFLDVAVMAPVPSYGFKVPLAVCGKGADAFVETVNALGMNAENLGDAVGAASMYKMIRSVCIKGFIALLTETLFAADRYNLVDKVMESCRETLRYDEKTFYELLNFLLPRNVPFAERMSHEMEEVVLSLESMDEHCSMSRASAEKLKWFTEMDFKKRFAEKGITLPETFMDLAIMKREIDAE